MWEMISGIPAFNNMPHDFSLALNICQGLRPEGTMSEYAELMKKCWDVDFNKRPTAEELLKYFRKWKDEYLYNDDERIPVPGK